MFKKLFFLFLTAAIMLSACGTWEVTIKQPATPMPPQASPTVVTATPLPLPSPVPTQSATARIPSASPTPVSDAGCNRAAFVGDVTFPDGSVFTPKAGFIKTWRLKNVGSCTWTTSYKLMFYSDNKLDGPDWVNLPSNVAPNAMVDLSVTLKAPATNGRYRSAWMLSSAPADQLFGVGSTTNKPFWVEIVVAVSTPPVTMPPPVRGYRNLENRYSVIVPGDWGIDEFDTSYGLNTMVIFSPPVPTEPFIAYLEIGIDPRTLGEIEQSFAEYVPDAQKEEISFAGQAGLKYTYPGGRVEIIIARQGRTFVLATDRPDNEQVRAIIASFSFQAE